MPRLFWLALLLGYLVGVAGAVLFLPDPVVEPLYAGIALASLGLGAGMITLAVTTRGRERLPRFGRAARTQEAGGPAIGSEDGAAAGARPVRLIATVAEDGVSAAELRELLDECRVEAWVRPVVGVPQRRAEFYHAVARLRAAQGEPLEPCRYQAMAARCGLLGRVDQLLLARCAQAVRLALAEGRNVGVFCKIAPTSLNDPGCVAGVRALLRDDPELAERLVVEVEQLRLHRPAREAVAGLREQGLRFCLRRLSAEGLDLALLVESGFAFVRIEAPAPSVAGHDRKLERRLMGLRRVLDGAGIGLVLDQAGAERFPLELPDQVAIPEPIPCANVA